MCVKKTVFFMMKKFFFNDINRQAMKNKVLEYIHTMHNKKLGKTSDFINK